MFTARYELNRYVFCVDLRTNSDYFSIQHWLTGFYNRGRECLQRGTDWIFKSDGYIFVLKMLVMYGSVCRCLLWYVLIAGFIRYVTFVALRKVLISRGDVSKKLVSAGLVRWNCFLSAVLRLCEGEIAWLLNVRSCVHNMQNNPHWYQRPWRRLCFLTALKWIQTSRATQCSSLSVFAIQWYLG